MKKKLLVLSCIVLSVIIFCTTVFGATYNKDELTITLVKDEKSHHYFGTDDFGEFTKEKTAFDATNKTIDITLTVKNNAEATSTEVYNGADVLFIIDNSNSMHAVKNKADLSTYTRCELVNAAASELSQKLLSSGHDIKVGIIEFATASSYTDSYDPAGDPAQTRYDKDALAITDDFTNDQSTINTALARLNTDWWDGTNPQFSTQTNIAAAFKLAQDFFRDHGSDTRKKNVIVLTDGIPELSTNNDPDPMSSYSEYSKRLLTPTVSEFNALANQGVSFHNVLIDLQKELNPEYIWNNYNYTKQEIAESIFGTTVSPVHGVNHYVTDSDLSDTITKSIYSSLISQIDTTSHVLTDINIVDTFPQKIIENFDFSIVKEPTKGSITKTTNALTWSIPELAEGETATVTYRLSLKTKVDATAVNIDLPTNEKVKITYKENDTPKETPDFTESPVVKLTPPAPIVNNTPVSDNTTANKTIPQTGTKASTSILSIGLISCLALLGIVSFTEYKNIKIK